MNATVKTFAAPIAQVRLSNLIVDTIKKSFSATLETKLKGARKWTPEDITGTMTMELADFFALKRDVKIEVADGTDEQGQPKTKWIATGEQLTSFQKYLAKRGIELCPVSSLVFESDNHSSDYAPFPFKIVRLKDRNVMSLVNIAPKKRTVVNDPNTGKDTVHYTNKYYKAGDKIRRQFISPQFYRRLIIESTSVVQLAQKQEAQA